MAPDEPEASSSGEVIGMKEPAVLVNHTVGLQAPTEERGAPRGEQVGPREAHSDPEHPKWCHACALAAHPPTISGGRPVRTIW